MPTVIGALRSRVPSQLLDGKAYANHNPNTKGNQEKGASSDITQEYSRKSKHYMILVSTKRTASHQL